MGVLPQGYPIEADTSMIFLVIVLAIMALGGLWDVIYYARHPEIKKPWEYPDL